MVDLPKEKCSACGACFNICHKQAIEMIPDTYGYIYPKINIEKCVDCGQCDNICPEIHRPQLHSPISTFAAKCKDVHIHSTVASGGIATIAANHFIRNKNGIVYGCAFLNCTEVKHIRVSTIQDVELLKGSKYVYSSINNIYQSVLQDLRKNCQVLFIGRPCQIGGLKNFLRKGYDNLTTIDLICHGVPALGMLQNEIKEILKDKFPLQSVRVNFRWKSPHNKFGLQFIVPSRGIVKTIHDPYSSYMAAFFSGLSYRENCHYCSYAQKARIGDLTIGDFWGLGKLVPSKMDPNNGISLILVNTIKGQMLMTELTNDLILEKRDFSEAEAGNWNLHAPSPRPANKDVFYDLYLNRGLHIATLACYPRFRFEAQLHIKLIRTIIKTIAQIPIIGTIGRTTKKILCFLKFKS